MQTENLILILIITMKKLKLPWKCEFYRRLKNKPKNKARFCDATIKGLRDIFNGKFKFYLKESHSNICNQIYNESSNKIKSDGVKLELSKSSSNKS